MQSKKAYDLKKELLEISSFTLYKMLLDFRSMFLENLDKKVIYKSPENHYFYHLLNNMLSIPVFIHTLSSDQPLEKSLLVSLINELEELKNISIEGFDAHNKHLRTFSDNKNIFMGYLSNLIDQLNKLQEQTKNLLLELSETPFQDDKEIKTSTNSNERQIRTIQNTKDHEIPIQTSSIYPKRDPRFENGYMNRKPTIPSISQRPPVKPPVEKNDNDSSSSPSESSTPEKITLEIEE